jgi:hypothetical protein
LLLAGANGNTGIIAAFLLTGNAIHVPAGKEAVVTGGCDKATGRSLRTHISTMVAVFIRPRAVAIAALLLIPAANVAASAVVRIGLQICASPAAAIISFRTRLGLTRLTYSICTKVIFCAEISIVTWCCIRLVFNEAFSIGAVGPLALVIGCGAVFIL